MCIPSASATIFHLQRCCCCLIPVLTLVVLLVMLDDIDDISFSKRRYFLIVSWMSISVYCIPTRDTHITRDKCMGIHISRGYTYHCDTGTKIWKISQSAIFRLKIATGNAINKPSSRARPVSSTELSSWIHSCGNFSVYTWISETQVLLF